MRLKKIVVAVTLITFLGSDFTFGIAPALGQSSRSGDGRLPMPSLSGDGNFGWGLAGPSPSVPYLVLPQQPLQQPGGIEALGEQDCCLTAQEILDRLRAAERKVGIASVYRILDLLVSEGYVQKIELGSAWPQGEELQTEIRGRDLVSGLPRSVVLTAEEVREALQEPLAAIVAAVRTTLERTPFRRGPRHGSAGKQGSVWA